MPPTIVSDDHEFADDAADTARPSEPRPASRAGIMGD
jgi:hypothetical protein